MVAYHASTRGVSTYQFIHELDDVARMKGLPLKFAYLIEQPIIWDDSHICVVFIMDDLDLSGSIQAGPNQCDQRIPCPDQGG